MVAARAKVTVRDSAGKMLWINDAAMAQTFLAQWGPVHSMQCEADEFSQRAAVVESGLRLQTMMTGDVCTPLSTAIRALRTLNKAVADAKHSDGEQLRLDGKAGCEDGKPVSMLGQRSEGPMHFDLYNDELAPVLLPGQLTLEQVFSMTGKGARNGTVPPEAVDRHLRRNASDETQATAEGACYDEDHAHDVVAFGSDNDHEVGDSVEDSDETGSDQQQATEQKDELATATAGGDELVVDPCGSSSGSKDELWLGTDKAPCVGKSGQGPTEEDEEQPDLHIIHGMGLDCESPNTVRMCNTFRWMPKPLLELTGNGGDNEEDSQRASQQENDPICVVKLAYLKEMYKDDAMALANIDRLAEAARKVARQQDG